MLNDYAQRRTLSFVSITKGDRNKQEFIPQLRGILRHAYNTLQCITQDGILASVPPPPILLQHHPHTHPISPPRGRVSPVAARWTHAGSSVPHLQPVNIGHCPHKERNKSEGRRLVCHTVKCAASTVCSTALWSLAF